MGARRGNPADAGRGLRVDVGSEMPSFVSARKEPWERSREEGSLPDLPAGFGFDHRAPLSVGWILGVEAVAAADGIGRDGRGVAAATPVAAVVAADPLDGEEPVRRIAAKCGASPFRRRVFYGDAPVERQQKRSKHLLEEI